MRLSLKTFLALAAVIISLFNFSEANAQVAGFEDALKQAKEQNKKVIVDIYTDWCGWCFKMDRDSYRNKDISKIIEDDFIFVKLNAEASGKIEYLGKNYSNGELAAKFEATGYPTTVFLSTEGNVIEFIYDKYKMNNLPGYFGAKDFKKVLEYIRDEKYKDTDLSTVL
jgi:thioredoxin-related protein